MSVTVNGVTTAPVIRDMVKGGVMHRFYTDKSIREYCKETGYRDPSISDTGAVYVTTHGLKIEGDTLSHGDNEIQIGWVG